MRSDVIALMAGAAAALPAWGQCGEWEVVPSPQHEAAVLAILRDIAVIAPDDVWAVGDFFDGADTRPMSLHWDGAAWTVVEVNLPPVAVPGGIATSHVWAVDASAPDDVWAAGGREFRPEGQFAALGTHNMVLRWDGGDWVLMDTPVLGLGSGDTIYAVEVIAPDDIWFAGNGHPQSVTPTEALMMHWDGSSFELVPVPLVNLDVGRGAGNPIRDLSAFAPDDIWAVGGTDVIADGRHDHSQIHHWDGEQWTHVPGPTPGYYNNLRAVAAVAPDDVWAAGEYWDVDGIYAFLIRWNGSSWTEVPAPGGILDMHAFAPDDIWAVGNGIFHYDGASWEVVTTLPDVSSPVLSGVDAPAGTPSCDLWAAGRQVPGQHLTTLTVRATGGESCRADFNGDAAVNSDDFFTFLADFFQGTADFDGDGAVNSDDYFAYLTTYFKGCN
jgi:hypothetical protein